MKVILICGQSRSGKNELANHLKKYLDRDEKGNYKNRTLIRGNAQLVKDMAHSKYNWNGVKDQEGRQLLIDITNKGYEQDPHYWEKETFIEAISYCTFINPRCEYLIIPDWRYAQTLDYFNKVADKVITIRVTRPNLEKGTHFDHSSENDFKNFEVDYQILNNQDLLHLDEVARRLCLKM